MTTAIIFPREDSITTESYVFSGNGGMGTIQLTADNWNGGTATFQTSIPARNFKFVNNDDEKYTVFDKDTPALDIELFAGRQMRFLISGNPTNLKIQIIGSVNVVK